jgi:polysaccharide biosynthesis protein PslH
VTGGLSSGPAPGRVAFLTHTPPLPPVSGERIRNWNLIRELADRGWSVSAFSLVSPDAAPSAEDRALLEERCDEVVLAPFTASGLSRKARVLKDLVLRRAFQSDFFLSRSAAAACRSWLAAGSFDVVVVGQLYMAPYVPDDVWPRAIFDTHNSEARRVGTIADSLGGSPKGIVASLQRGAVARFEHETVTRAARVVAVSEEERGFFEPFAPGQVDLVPNGVDCALLRPRSKLPAEPNILFLGSLDYSANVDAVFHLVDAILPRLAGRKLHVNVVGSRPRRAVYTAAARSPVEITVAGQVPDTGPYWEQARALVVPLRIGGGTRLKILEALARGVPVVSTSLGCEGLGLRPGEDLLVADEPGEFATCVERLLEGDDLSRSLAERGRATVEARYDWPKIAEAFERCLLAALGRTRAEAVG